MSSYMTRNDALEDHQNANVLEMLIFWIFGATFKIAQSDKFHMTRNALGNPRIKILTPKIKILIRNHFLPILKFYQHTWDIFLNL